MYVRALCTAVFHVSVVLESVLLDNVTRTPFVDIFPWRRISCWIDYYTKTDKRVAGICDTIHIPQLTLHSSRFYFC